VSQVSLECMNCDAVMPPFIKPRLYCSVACEQEAELIRYCRRCSEDGRINDKDIQFAIKTRLAFIVSGGYDKKRRYLSRSIRASVLERSKGKCEICGKPGSDIDHIRSSSPELSNLQFLCKSCHNAKTERSFVTLEPGTEQYNYVKARKEYFWECVKVVSPRRICHDEIKWPSEWRSYTKERKEHVYKLQKPI